jgi:3-hydroxyisobutyrate dehydrogenase-like beta-hydroxyacid dehydrogenase
MVANLIGAGLSVTVHDIDRQAVEAAADKGAAVASSAAEVAAATEISLSMIMDDRVLRSVALGDDGILAGAASGHLYCDLSTVSPQASAEVARAATLRSVGYLRGKVAGSTGLAEQGQLTVFASGTREDFDRAETVLQAFARQVLYVGEGEAAHYLKLAHSAIVGAYAALLGEAVTFARQGGVDYDTVIDVLESGPLASQQLTLKAPMLHSREFDNPPSDIDTAAKDLDLVLLAARGASVPMPLTAAVRQLFSIQQARGEGDLDIWSVIRAFEAMADVAE